MNVQQIQPLSLLFIAQYDILMRVMEDGQKNPIGLGGN